jgi:hypothetical protein
MAYSNIDSPKKYFDTKLYTGNGSTQSITGLSFKPDFFWTKGRATGGYNHILCNLIQGTGKCLVSNLTNAELTRGVTSFNSDGVSLDSNGDLNGSGIDFVSWNFLGANTTVSNTAGSITSTVSANTTSGFSIVSYTGTGSSGATVGHGLGVAPKMIIVKGRNTSLNWIVYHSGIGATQYIELNTTGAAQSQSSYNMFNSTAPTSSLFTLGNLSNTNGNTNTYIAYCFAEVKGFSKFGGYTGNNSLNNFVYTGFKPAFVMIKVTSTTEQWCIKDNKRNTYNVLDRQLFANASNAEDYNTTNHLIDFVSNGFNLKDNTTQNLTNGSGQTYIYMAFAENPFTSFKGIPCTAR